MISSTLPLLELKRMPLASSDLPGLPAKEGGPARMLRPDPDRVAQPPRELEPPLFPRKALKSGEDSHLLVKAGGIICEVQLVDIIVYYVAQEYRPAVIPYCISPKNNGKSYRDVAKCFCGLKPHPPFHSLYRLLFSVENCYFTPIAE